MAEGMLCCDGWSSEQGDWDIHVYARGAEIPKVYEGGKRGDGY